MIAAPLARARFGVGYGPAVTARFGLVSRLEQLRIAIAARLDSAASLQASRTAGASLSARRETGLAAAVRIDASALLGAGLVRAYSLALGALNGALVLIARIDGSAGVAAGRTPGASLPAAVGDSIDQEACRITDAALAASYEDSTFLA